MKVVIYGKPNCPWCDRAKELAKTKVGIEVEYIDISSLPNPAATLTQLVGKPVTTVPQIFVDGVPVGGFESFKPYVDRFETFDPNMNYFVRERGEGGWEIATYERYLSSIPLYEMDYKKEPKVV